jgi:hypothetical protein
MNEQQSPAVAALIEGAAEAVERFPEDELEAWAARYAVLVPGQMQGHKGFQEVREPEWSGVVARDQGAAVVRLLQAADIIIRLKADGEAGSDLEEVRTFILRKLAEVVAVGGVEQGRGFLEGIRYFATQDRDTIHIAESILGG